MSPGILNNELLDPKSLAIYQDFLGDIGDQILWTTMLPVQHRVWTSCAATTRGVTILGS